MISPQRLIDSSGSVVWQAQYDAFGKAAIQIALVENNLRFPGQYYDSESGLQQNWNQDYDSSTGRYIQRDPIGLEGGINTYGYVWQNSVMNVDPAGLLGFGGGVGSGLGNISGLGGAITQAQGAEAAIDKSNTGAGWQFGSTGWDSLGGWGQSASIGAAGYLIVCDDECKDPNGGGAPYFSEPDGWSTSWLIIGVSMKADGTICILYGLFATWPPSFWPTPEWNIPDPK